MEDKRNIGTQTKQNKNNEEEKQKGHTPNPTYLVDFLDHTQLIDVCRYLHPIEREFTHFSHLHQSFARLDYFMTTSGLLPKIKDIEIREIAITDHTIVKMRLQLDIPNKIFVDIQPGCQTISH